VAEASIDLDLSVSSGMVEPCLGLTEDGELLVVDSEAIVKDAARRGPEDALAAELGVGDTDGPARGGKSTVLALLDLRQLRPEEAKKFDRKVERFMAAVFKAPHIDGGVWFAG
jgi:hypothetical protein